MEIKIPIVYNFNNIEVFMADIKEPKPVKYFCGLLTGSQDHINPVRKMLLEKFGPIDIEAGPFDWNFTNYYEKQMGSILFKYFFSFELIRPPDELAGMKIITNQLETDHTEEGNPVQRLINLDPGYITLSSMILASVKPYSHRIYLEKGIYAQVDYLIREDRTIEFLPWTYPDYKTDNYINFFLKMRSILHDQLRKRPI